MRLLLLKVRLVLLSSPARSTITYLFGSVDGGRWTLWDHSVAAQWSSPPSQPSPCNQLAAPSRRREFLTRRKCQKCLGTLQVKKLLLLESYKKHHSRRQRARFYRVRTELAGEGDGSLHLFVSVERPIPERSFGR